MSHFAENLATKGYVVAAIDHTDSMYQDAGPFPSTLLNRPKDQKFVLDEMARFNDEQGHFLQGIVDTSRTGLIGYSMGGYGAMITAGAGVTEAIATNKDVSPNNILKKVMAGNEEHQAMMDDRFKAIIAVSPWGMASDFWDTEGLKNITKPMFFISGGVDDVSGYEKGTKKLFQNVINTDRYLLTFKNGNHNSAAPIPAPVEAWTATYNDGKSSASSHYTDPVWDTLRMNNIAQHFATAFFDKIIKSDANMDAYLDLIPNSNDGIGDARWKGFPPRTAKGLKLEYLTKQ
jgi:predicted dienelactone hydrolase